MEARPPSIKRQVSGYSDYALQGYKQAIGVPFQLDQHYVQSLQSGMHSITRQFNSDVGNIPAFFLLNEGMIQGAGYNQRIGDTVNIQTVSLDFLFVGRDLGAAVRIIVMVDRQPNGVIAQPGDYFENNSADVAAPVLYQTDVQRWVTRNRFVPLLDVCVEIPPSLPGSANRQMVGAEFSIPVPRATALTRYLASTTGGIEDVETNAYLCMIVSSHSVASGYAPTCTGCIRTMYFD